MSKHRPLKFFTGDKAPPSKPTDWLLSLLLARGAGTILFGQPGVSKTAHTAILVACLCLGLEFAGLRVSGKYRIFYIDLDGGWDWTGPLFRAAFRGLGIEGLPESFAYWSPLSQDIEGDALDNSLEFLGPQIVEAAKIHRADLVVIDSLGQFVAGDSNSGQDMALALRSLNPIRANGAAVLILDHSTKASKVNGATVPTPMGSQQKRAWARVTVALEEEQAEGQRATRWSVDKSNAKHFEPFLTCLAFQSDSSGQLETLNLELIGEAGPRASHEPNAATMAITNILERLRQGPARRKDFPHNGTYDRVLKRLVQDGKIFNHEWGVYGLEPISPPCQPLNSGVVVNHSPSNSTVVKSGGEIFEVRLREAIEQLRKTDSEKAESLSQALNRANSKNRESILREIASKLGVRP